MEHFEEPAREMHNENPSAPAAEVFIYPPKYRKQENPSNIWLRSLISLGFYLLIGYYIFPSYKILLLITAIVMIHELGHFIAMKFFRYSDLGIFFIPLLGAYVSGTKREVSQKESAIILLAGPLPGIILGIIFYWLRQSSPDEGGISGISYDTISLLFIILNLFNLLPVYPLDGGQLLNRVFFNENNWLSKIFIFLSAGFLIWFALYGGQRPLYILLILPAMMLLRLLGDQKMTAIEKRIEKEGIHTDCEYENLSDENYWKIRNILIQDYPPFRDVPATPPYEYHEKEERIMTTIQSLLHRHLIQDVSIPGKIFIFLLWAAAIASPWLLNMDMAIFSRLGL
ncbi:MAG: site-2 protease family protein [Bacteroidetes bacterium]|nr:site-2 protease family protein [Bacteroidota bacterium]